MLGWENEKIFLIYKAVGPWNRLCSGARGPGPFSHWWWNSPSQGCRLPDSSLAADSWEQRCSMAAKQLMLFQVGFPDVFPWRRKCVPHQGLFGFQAFSGAGSPALLCGWHPGGTQSSRQNELRTLLTSSRTSCSKSKKC